MNQVINNPREAGGFIFGRNVELKEVLGDYRGGVDQSPSVQEVASESGERKTVTPCNGCHMMMAGPRLCAKAILDLNRSGMVSGIARYFEQSAEDCNSRAGERPLVYQIVDEPIEVVPNK